MAMAMTSRSPFTGLSPDEIGLVWSYLEHPLLPSAAVAFSSTCIALRRATAAKVRALRELHVRHACKWREGGLPLGIVLSVCTTDIGDHDAPPSNERRSTMSTQPWSFFCIRPSASARTTLEGVVTSDGIR